MKRVGILCDESERELPVDFWSRFVRIPNQENWIKDALHPDNEKEVHPLSNFWKPPSSTSVSTVTKMDDAEVDDELSSENASDYSIDIRHQRHDSYFDLHLQDAISEKDSWTSSSVSTNDTTDADSSSFSELGCLQDAQMDESSSEHQSVITMGMYPMPIKFYTFLTYLTNISQNSEKRDHVSNFLALVCNYMSVVFLLKGWENIDEVLSDIPSDICSEGSLYKLQCIIDRLDAYTWALIDKWDGDQKLIGFYLDNLLQTYQSLLDNYL